jgi:hypothetical protein
MMTHELMSFDDAVRGFLAGDFSRLAPLVETPADGSMCQVSRWYEQGLFAEESAALAEAFSCACFNGCMAAIEYLLARGVDPSGGMLTGLNAFHWAVNRGELRAVELLIRHGAPLETRNAYGGAVLGAAVWAAVHEPKADHLAIIEALLEAGADVQEAAYPSGDDRVDEMLRQYGR